MSEEKYTALDLACEDIKFHSINNSSCICPIDCGNLSICIDETDERCIKRMKEHYQQQADIPDGWEVVKEIKQYTDKKMMEHYKDINEIDDLHRELQDVWGLCNQRLHEAGIETK